MLTALLAAVAIGAIMGCCGAGGGVLAVPVLVHLLGLSMQQAAPVALMGICAGSALGAVEGLRRGLARYRAAILMALVGMPFSALGLRIAAQLPQRWLMGGFALVCAGSAYRMLRQEDPAGPRAEAHVARVDRGTGRFSWSGETWRVLVGVGALGGLVAGLFGVGGGFVIVPLMRRRSELTMQGIVATSLLIMALISAGAASAALIQGFRPPEPLTAMFALCIALGVLGGRLLGPRLPVAHIQRAFAVLVLAVGAGMLLAALRG